MGRGAPLRPPFGDHVMRATAPGVLLPHIGAVAALEQGEVRSCSSQLTHLGLPVRGRGISAMLAPAPLASACL